MNPQTEKLKIAEDLTKALQENLEEVWSKFLFDWDRLSTGTADPIIQANDVRRLDIAITELGRAITAAQRAGRIAIDTLDTDEQFLDLDDPTNIPSTLAYTPPPSAPNRYKLVDQVGRSVPVTTLQDKTVENVLIGPVHYRAVFRGNPTAEWLDGKDATGMDRWLPVSDQLLELRVILNAVAQRQERGPSPLQPFNPNLQKLREIMKGQAAQMSTTFGVPSIPVSSSNGINVHNIHKPGE